MEKRLFAAANRCLFHLFPPRQDLMEFRINRNKPAHHSPAGSNIPLPQGVMGYWEATAMSKIPTLTQCVCLFVHVICSIQEVPWPFYYNTLVKILSLSRSHPLNHTHRVVVSFSPSQYVPRKIKHTWLCVSYILPKRCMAAIFRNWPFSQSLTRKKKRKNNNCRRQSLPTQKWGEKLDSFFLYYWIISCPREVKEIEKEGERIRHSAMEAFYNTKC